MAQFGKSDKQADAPLFDVNSKGESGTDQYGNTVFGFSVAEAQLLPGTAPGWVRVVQGTGGRSNRKFVETLVVARRFAANDPTASTAPTLAAGTPQEGVSKGVGAQGTYSTSPDSRTYEWYVVATATNTGGTKVATASTYTPVTGDVGKYLYVVEVADIGGVTVRNPSAVSAAIIGA